MNVVIVGSGYVGLVSGACFAHMGNNVVCVDVNEAKISDLQKGIISIYEPGLAEMAQETSAKKLLSFSTNLSQALQTADIVFIAVGTPQGEDGSADLRYVLQVARDIGKLAIKDLLVVDKSTVPVGTARLVKETIDKELKLRAKNYEIDVVSNPEFLKEGHAIEDFLRPDRIVLGANNQKSIDLMLQLYMPFTDKSNKFIIMDLESAEMTKYAANAMLATKISFINEIANICAKVGADVNLVRKGIGSDARIGYSFIYPGCGYGGSCFPKDVQALIKTATTNGINPRLIKATQEVNELQKKLLTQMAKDYFKDLNSKTFAIWGLSFKPETDDMREAASLSVVTELIAQGARLKVYDPKAMNEAKNHYFKALDLDYKTDKYECLQDADALFLVTEWSEFKTIDFEKLKQKMKTPIIFDGRNLYDKKILKNIGITYHQIGAKNE